MTEVLPALPSQLGSASGGPLMRAPSGGRTGPVAVRAALGGAPESAAAEVAAPAVADVPFV